MTHPKKHKILIAGASGVVGAAAVDHFAALPDWQVTAVSRRSMPLPDGVTHIPLDLTDASACLKAMSPGAAGSGAHDTGLAGTTHLLFAALYEKPDLIAGWRDPEQMAVNLAMLRNLLDALQAGAPGLRHVTILQGTKAYGGHFEPAMVPCKERWPRHPHPNFYWLQEDLLRERQPKSAWTFSILRPQLVLGYAINSPMNVIAALGAYACVMRELGRPFTFPGGGRGVNAGSDSRLIAQAAEFVATNEIAANETYNVVNGDMLVWPDLWASIGQRFGMAVGDPEPMRLAQEMPKYRDIWAQLAQRHQLREPDLDRLVSSSWQFADRSFNYGSEHPVPQVLSGIKLRQHGMAGCVDTEDSVHYWLERMQRERVLPR